MAAAAAIAAVVMGVTAIAAAATTPHDARVSRATTALVNFLPAMQAVAEPVVALQLLQTARHTPLQLLLLLALFTLTAAGMRMMAAPATMSARVLSSSRFRSKAETPGAMMSLLLRLIMLMMTTMMVMMTTTMMMSSSSSSSSKLWKQQQQ